MRHLIAFPLSISIATAAFADYEPVYVEDFSGETSLPTTPELDLRSLGGVTPLTIGDGPPPSPQPNGTVLPLWAYGTAGTQPTELAGFVAESTSAFDAAESIRASVEFQQFSSSFTADGSVQAAVTVVNDQSTANVGAILSDTSSLGMELIVLEQDAASSDQRRISLPVATRSSILSGTSYTLELTADRTANVAIARLEIGSDVFTTPALGLTRISTQDDLRGVVGSVQTLDFVGPIDFGSDDSVYAEATRILVEVRPTAVDLVNPNPRLNSGPAVSADPEVLALASAPSDFAFGMAADGVSVLLARLETPSAGTVDFELLDENSISAPESDVGSLSDPLDPTVPASTSMNIDATQLADGRWMAFALIHPPADYRRENDPNDESLHHRLINLSTVVIPSGAPAGPPELREIELHRVPVLLLHGLWSDGGTWDWPIQDDPNLIVYAHSYERRNDRSMSFNDDVAREAIRRTLDNEARVVLPGIAFTQVDVVGHSMGGLLARRYIASSEYHRDENFDQGDVHKLITLGSPHHGSPWADALINGSGQPTLPLGRIVDVAANVDGGAVFDLRRDQANYGSANVPAHALAAIGGSDYVTSPTCSGHPLPGELGSITLLIRFLIDFVTFDGEAHDLLVAQSSQLGGLSGSGESQPFDFSPPDCGVHWTEVEESRISDRVIQLLYDSVSDPDAFAAGLPAVTASFSGGAAQASAAMQGAATIGLAFSSPSAGGSYAPGDTVTFSVQGINGYAPSRVSVISRLGVVTVDSPPFDGSFIVPSGAVGTFEIQAVGLDSGGAIGESDAVPLSIAQVASLVGIRVDPDRVELRPSWTDELVQVFGLFDDAVERDVTGGTPGPQFLIADPAIATVSEDGQVTAASTGLTQLSVDYGAFTEVVDVEVVPEPGLIEGIVVGAIFLLAVSRRRPTQTTGGPLPRRPWS